VVLLKADPPAHGNRCSDRIAERAGGGHPPGD
jgi:hypothetical protein